MAVRLLHLADLHLDSAMRGVPLPEDSPLASGSFTRQAFEAAVGYALSYDVDAVVIAGDVYDGDWRDFSTGVFFSKQLRRLCAAQIPVVVISGNHDAASIISRNLTLPDGVTVMPSHQPGTVLFEEIGLAVHGQSFATREVSENLVASYPSPAAGFVNVGLLHTSLGGHPDHDPYAPCTPGDLERLGYDYWALGHIHLREAVSETPVAYYAGCIQGRSMRERGARGGLLVELEPGEAPIVKAVDFDVLRFSRVEIDCNGMQGLDELLIAVRAGLRSKHEESAGRPLICDVAIVGATPLHDLLLGDAERLRAELQLVADDVAPDALWLGTVRAMTEPPAASGPSIDPELLGALRAIADDPRTHKELEDARDALLARVPGEMLDPDAPLAWLADADAARARMLELGRAHLSLALKLTPGAEKDALS